MPDKKSSKEDSEEKGGGAKKLLPVVVIGIVMLGGGYFVGGMMSGGGEAEPVADAAEDEAAAEEEETVELGDLEALDAVNVNLLDGHFLRIAVTLEVAHEEHEESGDDGHGATEVEEVEFPTAPAADLVLSTFSGRSMEELASAEGREAARTELLHAVEEKYGEKVVSLYFTEFVMQ
ncbi:MAG: flagellar basal body-associated protein FliL [Ilumatobacter sp.]